MLPSISFEFFIIILFSVLIVLIMVLIFIVLRNSGRMNKAVYPLYEYTIKKAQKKAQKIIYNATKQAQEILVAAEIAGIKESAVKKIETRNLGETYRQNLDALAKEAHQSLTRYADKIDSIHKNILEDIARQAKESGQVFLVESNNTAQNITESLKSIKEKARSAEEEYSRLAVRLEDSMNQQIVEGREQISHSVEAIVDNFSKTTQEIKEDNSKKFDKYLISEFEKTQKEITEYRDIRMKILDKQLISLIERVTEITLNKKLSLKEHSELAYKALEEAKEEGIFRVTNENDK